VRDRPAGISDRDLSDALADAWQVDVAAAQYAPVGGGSYHWIVGDRGGRRWFATVDDLDRKSWLGDTREAVADGLAAAMEMAVGLRDEAGLPFVLAPIRARNGAVIVRLGSAHAVALFPYLDGGTGRFGEELPLGERNQVVDMLAALHRAAPGAARAPLHRISLARRGDLDKALRELSQPWHGGPFSEPGRALLGGHAEQVKRLLARFDRLAERVPALEPVITHGEPHPANLLRAPTGTVLIDWDTVGLAPPERDLWWVISDSGGAEARRYTGATGRAVDPAALALYRLRWALDDLSYFVHDLRSAHSRTADAERALRAVEITLASAPGRRGYRPTEQEPMSDLRLGNRRARGPA
jgi:spectinomycin phosphotransferase